MNKELKYPDNVNQSKYYLGKLCKRNHEYNDSGKSLRYYKNSTCFICHNQRNNSNLILTNNSTLKPIIDTPKYVVGYLCKYGHKYNNTNYSLRYKSNNSCIECNLLMQGKLKEHNKLYKHINKKHLKDIRKRWDENNPDKIKQYRKTTNEKYGDKRREEKRLQWHNHKHEPRYKLDHYMGTNIRHALKRNKSNTWTKLVGYTAKDLVKHLERQFDNKMNWNNYGSYWHIDHIIPKKLFHFTNSTQLSFRQCWALSNLRPLEKIENQNKSAKLIKPFQTILDI